MLSCAYVNYPSTEQSDFEHIYAVQHLPIHQERLKQVQLETERGDSCLRRARKCLFCPGMSSELKQYISTCETCQMFEIAPAKETLMSHDVPD